MESGEPTTSQSPPVDPRALLADWLRSLTLVSEGRGMDETSALIAEANQLSKHIPRSADNDPICGSQVEYMQVSALSHSGKPENA